jgi:hypothetical protein
LADNQRTLNWFLETIESGDGKTAGALYPFPGLSIFSALPDFPVRGGIEITPPGGASRTFKVAGGSLYEIFSDGTFTKRGSVANDGKKASIAASTIQIMIASAGNGYCFTLATNTLTAIDNVTVLPSPVLMQYTDTFFVALRADGKFQYSNPLDGTTWPGTSVSGVSVFAENPSSLLIDHRDVFIWSNKRGVAYFDSGNQFTFDVNPSGFIEDGIAGPYCRDRLDNTVFYLSNDERGNIQAKRLQGYLPQRISDHAAETKWRSYASVADCVSYAWGWNGHNFWQLYFPSANPIPGTTPTRYYGATWVYDVATQAWFERCFLDPTTGAELAHRSWGHTQSFGKHLVDDWQTGNVYVMDDIYLTDFGNNIKRQRRAPTVSTEQEWIYHDFLQIDFEVGLGPIPPLLDGAGNPRAPQALLRLSDNGGKTWGNDHWRDCGQAGQYEARVYWNQLGAARARVYELTVTDAAVWRIIDAYLEASGYDRPQPRLSKKISQAA